MYVPFSNEEIDDLNAHYSPSMVKAYNNQTFNYWQRSLYQRVCSRIQTTLPDNWEGSRRDYLLYCLLSRGYVFVSKSDKLGFWFQRGALSGFDFYYQPTNFILANARAKDVGIDKMDFELHKDGELLKFMPDYRGIFDIIYYYAEKLASLDNAINMSIINTKFAFVLGAKNKACAEAFKKLFDKINKGEPLVIYDKALMNDPKDDKEPWQFLQIQKLKENYITDQQLQDFATILNNFDSEIGICTLPYTKAERFVSAEANARQVDSQARINVAIECLKSSIKDIKKLYPDITLDFNLREEDTSNGYNDNEFVGNV